MVQIAGVFHMFSWQVGSTNVQFIGGFKDCFWYIIQPMIHRSDGTPAWQWNKLNQRIRDMLSEQSDILAILGFVRCQGWTLISTVSQCPFGDALLRRLCEEDLRQALQARHQLFRALFHLFGYNRVHGITHGCVRKWARPENGQWYEEKMIEHGGPTNQQPISNQTIKLWRWYSWSKHGGIWVWRWRYILEIELAG